MTPPTAPKSALPWIGGCLVMAVVLPCGAFAALVALGALAGSSVPTTVAGAPGERAAPAPAGSPVASTEPVTSTEAGGPRQTVTTADLVGDWGVSDRSSTIYVDRSTGTYAGSTSTSYGETYHLRADMTYTSRFRIIEGRRMTKSEAEGTWMLAGSKLLLTEQNGHTRGWWFLSYDPDANGESALVLLSDSYEVTESTMMYRDRWVRPAR